MTYDTAAKIIECCDREGLARLIQNPFIAEDTRMDLIRAVARQLFNMGRITPEQLQAERKRHGKISTRAS